MIHNFKELIYYIIGLINLAIPVVAGIALLAFIWGLVKFISKSGDPKGNKDGKSLMIWGIVALFVMVGFKGIIAIAQSQFGIQDGVSLIPIIKSNK